jgi:L-aminopeptidase/D-esterase-like protein
VFALATGAVEVAPAVGSKPPPAGFLPETGLVTEVGAAAADCLARAVLAGVFAAESVAGIPAYRTVLPGAFAQREP